MSWSYTGDPTADDLSKVRFAIADTDVTDPRLQDEEINAFLGAGSSVNQTILICLKFLIGKYAAECDYKIGPEQVWASQRFMQYKNLYAFMSKDLNNRYMVPQIEKAHNALFNVGMMDN